eukprot:1210124-Ditylum_brightwellii.AAC.1
MAAIADFVHLVMCYLIGRPTSMAKQRSKCSGVVLQGIELETVLKYEQLLEVIWQSKIKDNICQPW